MPFEISDELLDAVKQVESGGNPYAINKISGARGAYQFLPIGWKDVQQNYPELAQYEYESNVFDPDISRDFTRALLQLNARRLGKPTLDTLLASYNFGIGNVKKGKPYPKETINYINKIKKILEQKKSEKDAKKLLNQFGITK